MERQTLYTAVGLLRMQRSGSGQSYPVIVVDHQAYPVDMQELMLWCCLSWRIQDMGQFRSAYEQLFGEHTPDFPRPFEDCVTRLLVRGLIVSGSGENGFEALYDLLGSLYVAPVSTNPLLRVWIFLKLIFLEHVPFSRAKVQFKRDHPSPDEQRVLALSKQALLTTAELVKCVQTSIYDVSSDAKLLAALYGDQETTSENIFYLMQCSPQRQSVTLAIANLYLRKQVIFQRR